MDSGIYAIRNILDDKRYVGSSTNFSKRKKAHFGDLRRQQHFNVQLQRAVDLHGIDNFVFEILEELDGSCELLVERENHYMVVFDTIQNGYNLAEATVGGGDKTSNHPDNTDIRTRASIRMKQGYADGTRKSSPLYGKANGMFGKTRSREVIDKMTEGRKKYFEEHGHPFAGVPVSDERKQAISAANKGHTRWVGRHHSEETKQKLSVLKKEWAEQRRKAHGGIIPGPVITREHIVKCKIARNRPMVTVNDVEYVSCREASELTGEKVVRHRLNSLNIKYAHVWWSNNKKIIITTEDGTLHVIFEKEKVAV